MATGRGAGGRHGGGRQGDPAGRPGAGEADRDDAGDRRLVEAYVAGRGEAAFRALYRRYAPALWPFALRLCGGRDDEAEDLMQETWLRAARGLDGFRGDASLRTWLFGIAANVQRERARSRERRERRETAAARPVDDSTEPDVDLAAVDRVALARAIDRLPDGQREALVLHDVHGYTHEEIGAMVEIEPGSSRARVSRARAALRAILAEGGTR